ncbi:phosphatase 2C-like domain-containing protein [Flammula alnicola]|nr:phosphatase 2C-like domain-containing protein [Flammula alnicola]
MPPLDGQSDSAQTVSAKQLRSELARVSVATVMYGAHTIAFQPRTEYRSEDRHLVEDWKLSNGTWKFIGVFDGHGAGHEAVDFVFETLPGMIKASLASAVDAADVVSTTTIEDILVRSISDIDDRIKADLLNFFPGGPAQISKLTDNEIKRAIRDPETGNSYVQIMRARTGTTALVALIDPLKSLHVASLGDCEALLGTRNGLGGWEVKTLSKRHNASNKVEADRVRAEHPGEAECIHQGRTLGLVTLTRAIGDTLFKLPPIYTERVLALATPPFHENYKFGDLLARNLTPPYLSNRADVEHVDLASLGPNAMPVLILCSDGLCDLYSRRSQTRDIAQDVQLWLTTLTRESSDNLALELLWDALGGDDRIEAASKIVRGMPGRRVDDTTVVVLQL